MGIRSWVFTKYSQGELAITLTVVELLVDIGQKCTIHVHYINSGLTTLVLQILIFYKETFLDHKLSISES